MIIQLPLLLPTQCYGGCRFGLFDKAMQYCSLQKVLHFLHFHTSIVPWLELKERAVQYIISKEVHGFPSMESLSQVISDEGTTLY